MFNVLASSTMLIAILVTLSLWLWYLSSRPKNKGKELGVILIEFIAQNNVTLLMFFVIVTNLASAGIAANIAGPNSNPVSRSLTHFAIFCLSVFGAFGLLKSWKNAFTAEEISPGRRTARIFALLLMMVFAFGGPFSNLYLIAHGLHEIPHLMLWFATMNIFMSDDAYLSMLINSGVTLPENIRSYSAFQGISNVLASEIVLLVAGLLVLLFEILTAPDNHVRDTKEVAEDKDKKDDDKKDDKKKDEDKKKEPENALVTNFTKILSFVSIPISEPALKYALGVVEDFSDTDTVKFSDELDDLYANVIKHPSLKTDAEKKKNLEVTEKGIRDIFSRPKSKLGIGQQLKAKKS